MIAIISDTHMPKGERRLPDACCERLASAEAIVHAGDICTVAVLDALRAFGPPVTAVYGNVDDAAVRMVLPAAASVSFGGRTIAVIHDAGPAARRLKRLRRRFPDADAVVFGHSHIPLIETAADGAFVIVNPGSPTERRRSPAHTMALAELDPRGGLRFELVTLD
ncbi:MAG TPA: metallophosphoesterase family protein [Solirubrobacteraceae bacterium]|nr:metallophosphoesterase family protein [Solirubrobacteraceae bacterium]